MVVKIRGSAISAIAGAGIGLCIAIVTLLFALLNNKWDNEVFKGIINFITSIPTFLFEAKLNMPQLVQNVLFFIYWVLVGAIFGWLAGRKGMFSKMLFVILIGGLIIVHRIVQVKLEKELAAALEAIGGMLK